LSDTRATLLQRHDPRHPGLRARGAALHRIRLHDHEGDDLGLLEHPAPNVEPGDVVVLADAREAIVTSRVGTGPGPLESLLEVVVRPESSGLQD
jgi:hypothetical protein